MISVIYLVILFEHFLFTNSNSLDYATESNWATSCKTGTRQTPIDINSQIHFEQNQNYIILESANYTKLINVPLIVRNDRSYVLDASGLGTLMVKKYGIKYKYNLINFLQ